MSEEQKETAPTKEEFFKLADEWARATGHHSNSHIIMRHEAARKIAAMGENGDPVDPAEAFEQPRVLPRPPLGGNHRRTAVSAPGTHRRHGVDRLQRPTGD
jgi:hypothetical protein